MPLGQTHIFYLPQRPYNSLLLLSNTRKKKTSFTEYPPNTRALCTYWLIYRFQQPHVGKITVSTYRWEYGSSQNLGKLSRSYNHYQQVINPE